MCSHNSSSTSMAPLWLSLCLLAGISTRLAIELQRATWQPILSPFRTQPLRMHVENLRLPKPESHALNRPSRQLYLVKRS